MLKSLRRFDSESKIFFFHFGDLSQTQKAAFLRYEIELIHIDDFIGGSLMSTLRASRIHIELMWTLPSVIAEKLVATYFDSQITDVTYLDADLYFYARPDLIWTEIPFGKIGIIAHNFSIRLKAAFPQSGEFNVSWVSFPTNTVGRACSEDWSKKCIELCPSEPVTIDGKLVYGDQLYLEDWPFLFKGSLHVVENPGAGVAPWNYENYEFDFKERFLVDGTPLIFYHFSSHQFGFLLARRIGTVYSKVKKIPKAVYLDYEVELRACAKELGFKRWKSRFQPFYKRIYKLIRRCFKSLS